MSKPKAKLQRTRQLIILANLLAALAIVFTAIRSRNSTGSAEAASTGTPTQSTPTNNAE
jgi:hypothetical protein